MTDSKGPIIQILIENEGKLKSFIYSKVKNQTITADLFQDISLKALNQHTKLTDEAKGLSWLYTISRNQINDYFRQIQREQKHSTSLPTSTAPETTQDLEKCLRSFISGLPKKYRTPLILSDIQGFNQLEISNQLNLSHAGSRSRVQRARNLIKQRFIDTCRTQVNSKGLIMPDCDSSPCSESQ